MRALPNLNSLPVRGCLLAAALVVGVVAQAAGGHAPNVKELLAQYESARGGAATWAAVQSMGWTGHIVTAVGPETDLPFLMLFKRPNATRFEVKGQRLRAIRVFDGDEGWKVRPGKETGLDVQLFTQEDIASERDSGGLDGPLSNPDAKGITVALEGRDTVEAHSAWRLRVTLPSGRVQRHWLDTRTFAELRYDRSSSDSSGRPTVVSVYYRDYRRIKSLNLPMSIETRDAGGAVIETMTIEKVAINPDLAADTFAGPGRRPRHGGVVVDTSKTAAAMPP